MKFKKLIALVLVLACIFAFAGCAGKSKETEAPSTEAPATEAPATEAPETQAPETDAPETDAPETENAASITVTDMTGREITLDGPAERVVALTASDCEIIYALGAGDTLVGRGEYCDYPEDVFAVPSVQSGSETNIEQIIELAPQVVIMATMAQTEEQVKALEDAGIRVVVSDAQDIDGVYEAITLIGEITGKSDNAVKLVADMKDTFADLEARASEINKEGEKKTVYFEVSPLEYGLWAAGSGTFMNEVAEMLGLEYIFGDVEGWAEVSEEQVIEKAPDYIVTITMYFGEGPTPIEEIKGRAGWEGIPAVAEDQIINLQNNELSRPGPRLMEGAEMLFDFIYQEEVEEPAA